MLKNNYKNKTLAQYVLSRTMFMVVVLSLLFFGIATPILKKQLSELVSNQADAFANATVAATINSIYKKDFGRVVEYTMDVLKNSPETLYVRLAQYDGPTISIMSDRWESSSSQSSDSLIKIIGLHQNQISPFTKKETLEYSKEIDISGLQWGVISIGISHHQYQQVFSNILRNGILVYVIFIVGSLLIVMSISKRTEKHVKSLQKATALIATGDFTSRVQKGQIKEFNQLATSFNNMADSLENQTASINRMAKVVENTTDAILILDDEFKVIFANKSAASLYGCEIQKLYGNTFLRVAKKFGVDKYHRRKLIESLSSVKRLPIAFDIKLLRSDNQKKYISIRADKYKEGSTKKNNYFLLMTDITRRKILEEQLNDLAYYDKLTCLPNRQLFLQNLKKVIGHEDAGFALLFIDLDDFKMVNDTLGHESGDHLLKIVASRLSESIRTDDLVYRLGGDEFTIILNNINESSGVSEVCNKLIKSIMEPIKLTQRTVHIGSSIGAVMFPDDGTDLNDLLKKADMAMYEAKSHGKNQFRYFTSDLNKKVSDYVMIESELRHALRRNELYLNYQPIYRAAEEQLVGFEALIRWRHPERGDISPADFIPIAEKSGLISTIGHWVIEEACTTLNDWKNLGIEARLAVNVSGHQLHEKNFIENTIKVLNESKLNKNQFVMEFTESVLIKRQDETLEKLVELKKYGIQLALDDFGTGYSSLGYLNYFPIDIIKIDRSFINRIPSDERAISIVSAIISMTRDLGMSCVAEGVENIEHVNWLQDKNCKFLQGFYYSQAVSKESASQMLLDTYNNDTQNNVIYLTRG